MVGDNPLLPALKRRCPAVHFAGAQPGEALVRHYAAADVVVMPSRTETFGFVMLEEAEIAAGLGAEATLLPPVCSPRRRQRFRERRVTIRVGGLVWLEALLAASLASAALAAPPAAPARSGGTVETTVCMLVDSAARASHVPIALLTKLIWFESRFQPGVTSPKGAQGIAQFMPQTAAARGLGDPYDPEQAIPQAAGLIADLTRRFGNIGLAAAAYNAGSDRVAAWLAGSRGLPAETQSYVLLLTGVPADEWRHSRAPAKPAVRPAALDSQDSCAAVTAELRSDEGVRGLPPAPWGVQLSGSFSKAAALAAFARAERRYRPVTGAVRPMVIGRVLRSRGRLPFYRVMIPEASRAAADRTCRAILAIGGACVAVRS